MVIANPYEEIVRIKRSVDRLFESFGNGVESAEIRVPLVDMEDEKEDLVVYIELPDTKKEDIKLTLMENILTIVTEKREINDKREFYLMERQFLNYFRTVPLPEEVDLDSVRTKYKDGVLEVRLKKKNKKPQMKAIKL